MPSKKTVITIRVSDEVRTGLDQAAAKQRRSRAAMAQIVLEDWCKDHGYPKRDKSQKGH